MKKTINIEGMSCGHCTSSVEKALRAIPGVTEASVDLASKTATIEAGNDVSDDILKKSITDIGFSVISIK